MPVIGFIDNPDPFRIAFPIHETFYADGDLSLLEVIRRLDLYVQAEGFNHDHAIPIRARYQSYPPRRTTRIKAHVTWYHKQTGNPVKVLAVLRPPKPWAIPSGGWSTEACYVVDTGGGETWTMPESDFKGLFRKTKPRKKG